MQRVADPRAGVDVVDVEQVDLVDARLVERLEVLRADFVAGLDADAAGRSRRSGRARHSGRRFPRSGSAARSRPSFAALLAARGADLLAGGEDLLAGLGVDERERRLRAAPLLGDERHLPAVALAAALPGDGVVEVVEDLLAVEAERIEQRGDRQLALAVDADVDDVLGVELEVEPLAAVGDHPRGEQELARRVGLAAVVVEQHARRTVHLADDHALGAVDDEGAVLAS